MNAMKHQHHSTHTHTAILKDAFGSAKIGKLLTVLFLCFLNHQKLSLRIVVVAGHSNGVNLIGLSLQGPSVPGLMMKPCAPQGSILILYYKLR